MIDHIVLYGEPRGKERPRVANGHAYTPQKTKDYEHDMQTAWMSIGCKRNVYHGYVQMKVVAFFRIPKSAKKADRARMLEGDIRPTRRPDVDNILKIVSDSLQGYAYEDDKQINAMMIEKLYSDEPRVEVWLTDEGLGAIDAY